jgi:hypothetical protein
VHPVRAPSSVLQTVCGSFCRRWTICAAAVAGQSKAGQGFDRDEARDIQCSRPATEPARCSRALAPASRPGSPPNAHQRFQKNTKLIKAKEATAA